MLSRFIIKRNCSQFYVKSKCYENIHKVDSLKQDVNELKELIHNYHERLTIIYGTSILSLTGIFCLLCSK